MMLLLISGCSGLTKSAIINDYCDVDPTLETKDAEVKAELKKTGPKISAYIMLDETTHTCYCKPTLAQRKQCFDKFK